MAPGEPHLVVVARQPLTDRPKPQAREGTSASHRPPYTRRASERERGVDLRHVAEQQALVLYDGEVCLGAATIVARGPSVYDVAHPTPVKQQHQRQQQHADEQQPPPRGGRVHRLGTTGSVEV